jgi:glycosyltransferase involved in cell wall biosynthesis
LQGKEEEHKSLRILFVAFPESIHVVRWINQMTDQGWDIYLFPAREGPFHPGFRNLTTYGVFTFPPANLDRSVKWQQLWPPARGTSRIGGLACRFRPALKDRTAWLARVIKKVKPDLVHSLEFQHAGYLTLAAKHLLAAEGFDFPKWAVTNWGSDIYLFGRLPEHAEKIQTILSECDFYHCECHRDVALATSLGLKGEALPVFPVTGGFDTAQMQQFRAPGKTSARRVIALKGYQNWAGRALVGLRAIELCADVLKGYTVCIYMPEPDVKLAAALVSHGTGIPFEIEPQGWTREHVLRMHGRARVSIGLSISDAISTSLLEAMTMGSFPIQSNTGCGDEWITGGENGLLVPPESPEAVAAALRRAVTDDELVDRAAEINSRVTAERIDVSVVKPQVVSMYERIADGIERSRQG